MTHFFPAASRMDVERPSSRRRIPTREDATAEGRQTGPSHINWLHSSLAASSQAGIPIPMPGRPPSAHLGRSASLSTIHAPPLLRRQSSLVNNHSLHHTDGPSATKPPYPILEQLYIPTPTSKRATDVEPSTPVSIDAALTYSAFLRRPLKRSISASSFNTYNFASERTGSFITLPPEASNPEYTWSPVGGTADARGPSGSNTFHIPAAFRGTAPDPYTYSDTNDTYITTPNGSDSSDDRSDNSSEDSRSSSVQPQPRPRAQGPTYGGRGNLTSDTSVHQRQVFGSALSRPSHFASSHSHAFFTRLPLPPVLLFWAGFVAPWCWLIGGWLIAEGRWEASGKARAALPLWRPRKRHTYTRSQRRKGKMVARDVEKAAPKEEEEVPRRGGWTSVSWNPFAPRVSALIAAQKEKVVTLVKPYSAEVWVYRCRLAAVISAVMLFTALIVMFVIVRYSRQ